MSLKKAELLLGTRDFEGAKKLLRGMLLRDRTNRDAMYLLGIAEAELKNNEKALSILSRIIAIDPQHGAAHYSKANLLLGLNRHCDALPHHDEAVKLLPLIPWVFVNRGISRAKLMNLKGAMDDFDTAISLDPKISVAYGNKANALLDMGRFEESLKFFDRAIELDSFNTDALLGKSTSLTRLNRPNEALTYCDRAIELKPNYAEAWLDRGVALGNLLCCEEALASYERSIEIKPNYAEAWSNRGVALDDLKRHEEALASYDRSIELQSDYDHAWYNRGNALRNLRRHEEALASYNRSIDFNPEHTEAWLNRGVALGDLRRHEEALASYERAIDLKSDYAEAWSNRGVALNDLKRHEEALASYERSIALNPNADLILGDLVHTQLKICDWTDFDGRCQTLERRLSTGDLASDPFPVLGLFDAPHLHKWCAELHAKNKLSFDSQLGLIGRRGRKDKIRVGYFSMDFREHPVAHLIAELIECHDRKKFEIYGFSFGVDTGDTMRKRLEAAFDKFLEVRLLSELDIAHIARDHEIDIAIDLGGYTKDSRPAIFAHRAAPIQINYLGFPGTMGMGHLDYFIGDRITVSDTNLEYCSEKVIFLPNSFLANPSSRPIGSREPSRASCGLPESGLVFCCFNNIWKITPNVFKLWVSILQKVKGSVLWLQDGGETAKGNLSRELESAGIGANRIVFAGRLPCLSDHLSRYRLADLFLDTFPYGAHTTASDALWAGLPVLTRTGESFASRVASSLLNAVGLPELITQTTEEYESLAIELANNPEKVVSLKARLAGNRATCPLFNTVLFTQHIESAYQAAYDRHHDGLAPEHIYVSN